jgi:hypothetical protein
MPFFALRPSLRILLSLIVGLGSLLPLASAQPTAPDCVSRTATNATLILPESLDVFIDGERHNDPLRVDVVTDQGKCVGTAQWNGSATALTVWGHSSQTTSSATSERGLSPGDSLHVRLFDPTTHSVYHAPNRRPQFSFRADQPHLLTTPQYVPNGLYVLDRIHLRTTLVSREE